MPRDHHSPADQALRELRELDNLADAMDDGIRRILFQPWLRSYLMALKDEFKESIASATAKVVATKERIATLIARITELENTPGAWTDGDIAEIKDALVNLNTELDSAVA